MAEVKQVDAKKTIEGIIKELKATPDMDPQSKKMLFLRSKLLLDEVESRENKSALAGKLREQIKEAIKKSPSFGMATDLAEIGWMMKSFERSTAPTIPCLIG